MQKLIAQNILNLGLSTLCFGSYLDTDIKSVFWYRYFISLSSLARDSGVAVSCTRRSACVLSRKYQDSVWNDCNKNVYINVQNSIKLKSLVFTNVYT